MFSKSGNSGETALGGSTTLLVGGGLRLVVVWVIAMNATEAVEIYL